MECEVLLAVTVYNILSYHFNEAVIKLDKVNCNVIFCCLLRIQTNNI